MVKKVGLSDVTPAEWDAIQKTHETARGMKMYHHNSPKYKQVGGDHYKKMAIQPIDYCVANKLDPYQTNIVKYASRMYNKNQCLSDLDKIIHYAELAKENAIKKGIK
jgi:hypothetical protein